MCVVRDCSVRVLSRLSRLSSRCRIVVNVCMQCVRAVVYADTAATTATAAAFVARIFGRTVRKPSKCHMQYFYLFGPDSPRMMSAHNVLNTVAI
jgi:hypothetical protein